MLTNTTVGLVRCYPIDHYSNNEWNSPAYLSNRNATKDFNMKWTLPSAKLKDSFQ